MEENFDVIDRPSKKFLFYFIGKKELVMKLNKTVAEGSNISVLHF